VEALQDVEKAVDEEGIILDQLVILGDLIGSQEPELGVDGVVLLGLLGRHGCCCSLPVERDGSGGFKYARENSDGRWIGPATCGCGRQPATRRAGYLWALACAVGGQPLFSKWWRGCSAVSLRRKEEYSATS
jgi:hypothetical protein